MPFPTVVARNTDAQNSNATSFTIDVPGFASRAAGDLAIICITKQDNDAFTGTFPPTGWTQGANVAGSTLMRSAWIYRRMAGDSNDTSTITVTGDSENYICRGWLIRGAHPSTNPESINTAGSASSTDLGALDPSGWAAEDTLWLWYVGINGNTTYSSFPASYTDTGTGTTSDGTTANRCGQAFCERTNAVSSENPGAATQSATSSRVGYLIAVRPAPAGASFTGLSTAQSAASSAATSATVARVASSDAASAASAAATTATASRVASSAASAQASSATATAAVSRTYGTSAAASTAASSSTTATVARAAASAAAAGASSAQTSATVSRVAQALAVAAAAACVVSATTSRVAAATAQADAASGATTATVSRVAVCAAQAGAASAGTAGIVSGSIAGVSQAQAGPASANALATVSRVAASGASSGASSSSVVATVARAGVCAATSQFAQSNCAAVASRVAACAAEASPADASCAASVATPTPAVVPVRARMVQPAVWSARLAVAPLPKLTASAASARFTTAAKMLIVNLNTTVRLTCKFYGPDGALVSPASAMMNCRAPDGTLKAIPCTEASAGVWYCDVQHSQLGLHRHQCEGAGVATSDALEVWVKAGV